MSKHISNHYEYYQNFVKNNRVLIKYITNNHAPRRGVVVAFRCGNTVMIGHSILNPLDEKDKGFNKYLGFRKAVNNRVPIGKAEQNPPHLIEDDYLNMVYRARSYFKPDCQGVS